MNKLTNKLKERIQDEIRFWHLKKIFYKNAKAKKVNGKYLIEFSGYNSSSFYCGDTKFEALELLLKSKNIVIFINHTEWIYK